VKDDENKKIGNKLIMVPAKQGFIRGLLSFENRLLWNLFGAI